MNKALLLAFVAFISSTSAISQEQQSPTCPFIYWTEFRNTKLYRTTDGSAYAYQTVHLAIDADGAPNAYCEGDTGIDKLKNANYPKGSWSQVLVPDPKQLSRPYKQPSGEYKGCYIAQTSLRDQTLADIDVRKYVDARQVPYMVFPTGYLNLPGTGFIGDVAVAQTSDRKHKNAAIVADSGGGKTARLGEISLRFRQHR